MIRSVLGNQPFDTWAEFTNNMNSIYYDSTREQWTISDPETYRRLRMISRQYVAHRTTLQSFNSLKDIEQWLNTNSIHILNVPLNYLDRPGQVYARPTRISFRNMIRDDDIDTKFYIGLDIDEPVVGKGWSGEIIVEIPVQRHPTRTLLQGLGAYGIYTRNIEYSIAGLTPYYIFSFVLLERDFQLKNFNEEDWKYHDSVEHDDDFFDNMSEDDLERWDRDRLFDDDAQLIDMDIDHGFK